jgi:hypothetical protein
MSFNPDISTWTRQTVGGIRYRLMEGAPTGTITEDTATATETYIIRSIDLLPFALESFPLPTVLTQDDGDTIYIRNKRRMPGFPFMASKQITFAAFLPGLPMDPFSADSDAADGTYADFLKVTITYQTAKAEEEDPNDPETFLEISCRSAGEFLQIPQRGQSRWQTPTGEVVRGVNTPVTKILPDIDWSVRWPMVPREVAQTLVTTMRSHLGHINSEEISLLSNAPEDTILFTGFAISEETMWTTQPVGPPLKVDLEFLERHIEEGGTTKGHNYFYREDAAAGAGKFQLLYLPDGNLVYESSDLNEIFPPSYV